MKKGPRWRPFFFSAQQASAAARRARGSAARAAAVQAGRAAFRVLVADACVPAGDALGCRLPRDGGHAATADWSRGVRLRGSAATDRRHDQGGDCCHDKCFHCLSLPRVGTGVTPCYAPRRDARLPIVASGSESFARRRETKRAPEGALVPAGEAAIRRGAALPRRWSRASRRARRAAIRPRWERSGRWPRRGPWRWPRRCWRRA